MATKKLSTNTKPLEILEIERAYKTNIDLFEPGARDIYFQNTYSVNSEGIIIHINITRAKLNDLGPISTLRNLKSLNLSGNQIVDISPISPLIYLKHLNLRDNQIVDISPLSSLKLLQSLIIGENKIKNIEPLSQLIKLNELLIGDNPIEDINPLNNLYKLRKLYCYKIRLTNLNFIHNLKNLRFLSAGTNKLSDIKNLSTLVNLKEAYLRNNSIGDISPMENLENLIEIDLGSNKIQKISKKLAEKFDWLDGSMLMYNEKKVTLNGNPLEFPPSSVIELGKVAVKNYYDSSDQYGYFPLSEGRIIFVGDGSSGKSSIIEKILYNTFALGREQTNGIKIENMHLQHPEDNRDLTFHIWDFGGQEIQHAVHKFFFTEGCLYVLVLDNRKEEEPEYWLQQIESLGGGAPVLVVFNKQDENAAETADRKFLKEKYPNIVGFYKTSCQTGFGIDEFKKDLEHESVKLKTVNEQFPKNWLVIKKTIQERTNGSQHYLTYEAYREICKQNSTLDEQTQKLLLRYFNTIGAVTWFGGDTYLQFLHILNPAWLTQGVYKILTSKKTAKLFGQINVADFKELLQPLKGDYTYDEAHYGYILSMMKKFDLCYTPDEKHLLIPSAFGKEPKVEYSDYRGENIRTYILQFKDYMPLALVHRFTAKNIDNALGNNYWYTGIVIKDSKSNSLTMVHADKDAKRIYVRIKDGDPLGVWGHVRREFAEIIKSYARIPYDERLLLQDKPESTVKYDDLVGYIKGGESVYFEPTLGKRFNVGYLMGLFESKDNTLEKIKTGEIELRDKGREKPEKIPPYIINVLNNISPIVNVSATIQVNIDIKLVNDLSSAIKGDASYLLKEIGKTNEALGESLKNLVQFTDDAKAARNSSDVIEKGWKRNLKNIVEVLSKSGDQIKHISDGTSILKDICKGLYDLAHQFNLGDVVHSLEHFIK